MARKKIDYSLAKKVAQSAALAEQINESSLGSKDKTNEIEIALLHTNPYQPRIDIDENQLRELADSIKNQGLLQPIVVADVDGKLTIVAGHRRVIAHKLLKKPTIKATKLQNVVHAQLAVLPLIENLQRDDTDPIENAIAFKRLLDEKVINSQNELAELVGVSKSWLSKTLSVLRLKESLLSKIKKDKYTDLTVLSALNKLDTKDQEKVYKFVKDLTRKESLEYIKTFSSSGSKKISPYSINSKKVTVNLTLVADDKKDQLNELLQKIEELLS